MKIGILTFHRAHNYGAVLQAYALQECIKSLGHDVCFIDYRNKQLLDVYKLFNIKRVVSRNPVSFIKRLAKELSTLPVRAERSTAFNRFINSNLLIDSDSTLGHINSAFDFVFVGSDQVWNFHLTRGFDKYYWGKLKQEGSALRIVSYAASMEVGRFSTEEKAQIQHNLNNFDIIGVREDSLKESLKEFTNKEITVVADPTLLLDRSVWDKTAVRPSIDRPYLLLYQVRNNEKNELLAKKIARDLGLDIVYLSARVDAKNSHECVGASPGDYLGLFKYASFVLCSSFHGTVFSTVFNVPFFSILMNDGKDSRSLSLLNYLNLGDRAINYDSPYVNNEIDWNNVKERLEEIKASSLMFISRAIQ